MQKSIPLHLFSEIPPLLFSHPSHQFWYVNWPLLPSFSITLSLLIVVICLFSCIWKVLLIMAPHFHFFCLYSFCLFLVCDPLLFVPSCCLRKSVCWISCCIILLHLSTHLVLVADCFIKFSPFLLPLFFFLVYWHGVCFQQPKTKSPPPPNLQ